MTTNNRFLILKCRDQRGHRDLTEMELQADLSRRTRLKLPPGYKDASKPDGGIGDVITWHSILRLGKTHRKNVLFVSNDEKPDWQVRTSNTNLSARPELREEFRLGTGQHFGILTYSKFLRVHEAKSEAVNAVERVSDQQISIEVLEFEPRLHYCARELRNWINAGNVNLSEYMKRVMAALIDDLEQDLRTKQLSAEWRTQLLSFGDLRQLLAFSSELDVTNEQNKQHVWLAAQLFLSQSGSLLRKHANRQC